MVLSETVTIRPAVADDAGRLHELRLEALANHPEAFASDYASTAAQGAEVWAQRIAANTLDNQGITYVATVGEQLIGMARIGRGDRPKTRHTATIAGVYVRPEWRGRRVAEKLLQACIGWGRAHGVVIVKLAVVTTNAAAIRCYTRCGFTVYGTEPQAICHDGVCYDELLMARPI
jgi:ribosomal protein S18 acetylase RimI-like enzyme